METIKHKQIKLTYIEQEHIPRHDSYLGVEISYWREAEKEERE